MELPEFVKRGEVARLFPVIAETGKEQRAASIFLSVLSAVPPLSTAILSQLGLKIGARMAVNTFIEVVFQNESSNGKTDRPDGLIEVVTGKRKWSALLEAKIGTSTLEAEQIERYLRLARENGIDSVVTISNEFAARPDHHPVAVNRQLTRRVSLYHLSWTSILTSAILLQEKAAVADPEQAFLLREFVRFFSHQSAGISRFTSMPPEWSTTIERFHAGGGIGKGELGQAVVSSWHQELKDLALLMSRLVGCEIETKLPRAHAVDPAVRLKDDVDKLCSNGQLAATLSIPNAAADLHITADLKSRALRASMILDAPRDKKRSASRVSWLLRQLKSVDPDNVSVGVIWASRAPDAVFALSELRKHPELVGQATHNSEIRAFEVLLTSNSARRFGGRRTFIEELEDIAPRYYETIGQFLHNWTAPPPKPKHSVTQEDETKSEAEEQHEEPSQQKISQQQSVAPSPPLQPAQFAGNFHSELLEIPDFLRRSAED